MTLKQAREFVRAYQDVLSEDATLGGRRNPSLLPTSKEDLQKAIRLELAWLYYIGQSTDETLYSLTRAAMALDSFTRSALDAADFIETMKRRREEMDAFYLELLNVGTGDRFYWQRVYALVGLSCETKSSTLFQSIKAKLGIPSKNPSATASQASVLAE
jgi:hypothetical protein